MNEKVLNPEERIRRAEEIYYRRKNKDVLKQDYTTLNLGEKKDFSLFRKMTIQLVICLLIYSGFYIVKNSNYIFSQQLIDKTKEIMDYDINFENLRDTILVYLNNFKNVNNIVPETEENVIENTFSNEVLSETIEIEPKQEEQIQNEKEQVSDGLYKEDVSSISQVEEDANYIKATVTFIKPLNRNYNFTFWSKKSNNSNSTKISYRYRYKC